MTEETASFRPKIRELTGHKVNPANDRLNVLVIDEPGSGGAHHAYVIAGMDCSANPSIHHLAAIQPSPMRDCVLVFQNGPIAEVGVNGVTHEALLAILIDRLEAFQRGPFANSYNAIALENLLGAQRALHARTLERMNRGVEGTHKT